MGGTINVDPRSTALILIDMQNVYCDDKGGWAKRGFDIEPCKAIIPNVERITAACRLKGIPVIYTKQEHLKDDPEFVKKHYRITPEKGTHLYGRLNGKPLPVQGTWDAEFLPSLAPQEGDFVVPKQKFSGFFGTNLEVVLRMKGIDTLIVTGVASNVCVESTIRDAYFREFTNIVVKDGIGTVKEHEDLHWATLKNVEKYLGWVVTSEELLGVLAKLPSQKVQTPSIQVSRRR